MTLCDDMPSAEGELQLGFVYGKLQTECVLEDRVFRV